MYYTNHSYGSWGATILVDMKWKDNFVTWGTKPSQHAVWILLEVGGFSFGIINIYASIEVQYICVL